MLRLRNVRCIRDEERTCHLSCEVNSDNSGGNSYYE